MHFQMANKTRDSWLYEYLPEGYCQKICTYICHGRYYNAMTDSSGQPECIARQICFHRDHHGHARSTRLNDLLLVPPIRTEADRRRFVHRSPHLMNELPASLRDLRGSRFRKGLKVHLLAARDT